jgi:triosephosphate isomerase
MARKPFMAGNWKMNLDHLEAIAHVQKIAFALNDEDFAAVEAGVMVPFTDIRSVQTLVDADNLKVVYGSQDISAQDSGAYTGEISGPMLAKLGLHVRGHRAQRAPPVPR